MKSLGVGVVEKEITNVSTDMEDMTTNVQESKSDMEVITTTTTTKASDDDDDDDDEHIEATTTIDHTSDVTDLLSTSGKKSAKYTIGNFPRR